METTCAHCGHANPPGGNFCSSCGAQLSVKTDHPTDTYHVPNDTGEYEVDRAQFAPDEALLVVTRGPKSGARYALDKAIVTAGRHPDSDIFLDDVTVSRRHAEFVAEGGQFAVRDVGSLNGTYLNRKRIDRGDLADGDDVQIGRFKLVFLYGSNTDGS